MGISGDDPGDNPALEAEIDRMTNWQPNATWATIRIRASQEPGRWTWAEFFDGDAYWVATAEVMHD